MSPAGASRYDTVVANLARLRRGYRRLRAMVFSLAGIFLLSALATLFTAFDLLIHFSTFGCWLFWSLGCVTLLAAGVLVARALREQASNAAMAVLVEKVLPSADNHIVNAVQLAETGPEARQFVEELLAEAPLPLAKVRPGHLISPKPIRWLRRGLAGTFLLLAALALLSPRGTARSLLRFLAPMAGLPPFTLTHITAVIPGKVTVLRGAAVPVRVRLAGVIPKHPVLVWEKGHGKSEEIALAPLAPEALKKIQKNAEAETATGQKRRRPRSGEIRGRWFGAVLQGVFYQCRYRIEAGDAASPWFTVNVTNPPGLDAWIATVAPPKYTRRKRYRLTRRSESMEIPENSRVTLSGTATGKLTNVQIVQGDDLLATGAVKNKTGFQVGFPMRDGAPLRLRLVGVGGLTAEEPLPFVILLDQPPTVVLPDQVKARTLAGPEAKIPVTFQLEDDYGLTRVGLTRLFSAKQGEEVTAVAIPRTPRHFQGRFIVDLASFNARPGDTFRFQVWAEDNGPAKKAGALRRGWSRIFEISVPEPKAQEKARKELAKQSKGILLKIIKLQRTNLRNARHAWEVATLGKAIPTPEIQTLQDTQNTIRRMTAQISGQRQVLGDLATVLAGLVNHEMAEAVTVLGDARRAVGKAQAEKLGRAVALETRILAALTGIPADMSKEQLHQEKVDLLERLQKLVAAQIKNLKATKKLRRKPGPTPAQTKPLAHTEDRLANDLIGFTDHCSVMLEQRIDDDFATQIRRVYHLLDQEKTYDKMVDAADALDGADLAAGIQNQQEALKTLLHALDILNRWRVKNAKKIAKDAAAVLKEVADALKKMEQKQAHITEVTRDLAARGKMDDQARKKLAELDKEQKPMADTVEKLAQDLYQFPDLPVCNELKSKMREIYEDVEQAMDSENAPNIEIAVQKEDSLLDAIRKTKDRVEDVEMWLPDVPDNITWNMESFDTDEFPNMPLVPLPDELEDIVGDLLDQAQSIAQKSQDTTGNNMIADMEMGWGVMDGPMPCFSAKGKSGNTRPNDNEMTGRSGAGREGQSNGELVENHVKGLEGTKTHARRTRDPFQKGQVTEDQDSTMKARSTGGGKLGGESESIGMFGKAPRRDLNGPAHGASPVKLRQETEALYATARLLYLGTGSLGSAARELRGLETKRRDLRAFGSLHRKVLRRLQDTEVELNSGVVLPMPVATVSKAGGAATRDVDVSKIPGQYRTIVSDYYRSLNTK